MKKKKTQNKKKEPKPSAAVPFSSSYDDRKLRKEIGRTGLFLCLLCAVLAFVFFVRGLAAVGAREILSYCFAAFFAGILLIYVFFPVALFRFLWKLRPVTDMVGKCILRVLLIPVYLLLCIVSFPFAGRQRKKYRFAQWDGEAPSADSYFSEDTQNAFRGSASGTFRFLTNLLETTAKNGQYFLFPVLLLLLLLGLFFYFISSSSILGFIYTLF